MKIAQPPRIMLERRSKKKYDDRKNIFSLKDPKSELMAYDDSCIDLVVTAPPVFTLKGKEVY